MKTIEHMKIICVKKCSVNHFLYPVPNATQQERLFQPKRKKNASSHINHRKSIRKSSTCGKVSLVSEYIIKNFSNSSKKRPLTVDKYWRLSGTRKILLFPVVKTKGNECFKVSFVSLWEQTCWSKQVCSLQNCKN